jgi:hypothetical protein
MTVYVVAGSTQEYERWLGDGGTRYEHETVCLLPSPKRIREMDRRDRLVLLEHWRSHPQWRDIYNTMLATGRRGIR